MFDWFTELSGFQNFVISMLTVNMILLIQIREQLWAVTITITTAVSPLTISLDMTSNRHLVNGSYPMYGTYDFDGGYADR